MAAVRILEFLKIKILVILRYSFFSVI